MKRLYYLTSSIDDADRISEIMHGNGVTDWHFHVVSRDEAGLYKHHLHSTSFVGKTDLLHSGERGALFGFASGLLLSLIMHLTMGISLSVVFLTVAMITCFGAWAGGLIGISHVNYRLARFQEDIDAGGYLIMVDVPKDQSEEIDVLMRGYGFDHAKVGEDPSRFINPLEPNSGVIFKP